MLQPAQSRANCMPASALRMDMIGPVRASDANGKASNANCCCAEQIGLKRSLWAPPLRRPRDRSGPGLLGASVVIPRQDVACTGESGRRHPWQTRGWRGCGVQHPLQGIAPINASGKGALAAGGGRSSGAGVPSPVSMALCVSGVGGHHSVRRHRAGGGPKSPPVASCVWARNPP